MLKPASPKLAAKARAKAQPASPKLAAKARAKAGAIIGLLLLGAAGCSSPPLTEIGRGWFVDEGKPPWAHLYRVAGGKRVLVDRQIDSYRMYYTTCLAYEASRPGGRVVFVAVGDRTPYTVTATDTLQPWRIDVDGVRRFDRREDTNGRVLLAIEFIDLSDLCYAAQMTKPFQADWAKVTPVVPGRVKIVESIVEVNGADSVGNSTLSDAVRLKRIVLVDELLRAGADVNSTNRHGGTPLMTAVWSRDTEVVRRLLEAGAWINAQADNGHTALMDAAHTRNREMAELLLDAGADVRIRDDLGRNAAARVPDGGGPEMDALRARLARAEAASTK